MPLVLSEFLVVIGVCAESRANLIFFIKMMQAFFITKKKKFKLLTRMSLVNLTNLNNMNIKINNNK
jgi:hypothetical protein